MTLPHYARFLIIGAGIHGLSTAWHLAKQLRAKGQGSGADILVIDKQNVGAGASGIACGVVRNNYFQPAMRELMAHSVSIWESDPAAFHYHSVGYMQISPEVMREDVAGIAAEQADIGYESVFIDGEAASKRYMRQIFDDWEAPGTTSVLHEKRGGYAHNRASVEGLAAKARMEGVEILTGVTVTGFTRDASGAISQAETDHGAISCDQVVVAVGPWVQRLWAMLELPETITIKAPPGDAHEGVPMWTYWSLQEGTLGIDPELQKTNEGKPPPVVHVDSDEPLISYEDGSLITDQMWGIYYKPDTHFGGIQGGASPFPIDLPASRVAVDPYGPDSPDFIVGEAFAHLWTSALGFCQRRFRGTLNRFNRAPSGGIGCFSPDNFPIFDVFCDNCYIVADSNHGYKMLGVGELVANELLGGCSALLQPFRFSRYAQGELHPTSNSPFPWS